MPNYSFLNSDLQSNLIRKTLPNNIITEKSHQSRILNCQLTHFLFINLNFFYFCSLSMSKILHILIVLLLFKLTLMQDQSHCSDETILIGYAPLICEIEYQQCPQNNKTQIQSCIAYQCRFQLGGKCYFYSYQYFETKRCLNECCGYKIGSGQTYTIQQVSQCLKLNMYQQISPPEGPFNKLPIILGSILGVVFFIILTTCICCRQRIRAIWDLEDYDAQSRPKRKNAKIYNEESQSKHIKFILQNSDQNINYDKQTECTICLSGSNEIQTVCGHWFHLGCLASWVQKNYLSCRCPNCNSQQVNPVKILCGQCHKPFVEIKLNRFNNLRSLKKLIRQSCKSCNQLKS